MKYVLYVGDGKAITHCGNPEDTVASLRFQEKRGRSLANILILTYEDTVDFNEFAFAVPVAAAYAADFIKEFTCQPVP